MLIDGYGPGHSKGLATRRPPNKELKLTSVEPIGRSQLNSGVRRTCRGIAMATRGTALLALILASGCSVAPPRAHVELIDRPTTLSQTPQYFSARELLPADNDVVGVCVYPELPFKPSDHWIIVTPDGGEARITAHAELTSGAVATLSSTSTNGPNLCLELATSLPSGTKVKRVRLVASKPVVASRIVWQSTAP
jgi:hypothetical protein